MPIFFPIVAAVLQAGSFVLDKFILLIPKVNFREYLGVSFPLIFIINALVFLILRPPLNATLFTGIPLLALVSSVLLSIASNLIYYRALQSDRLTEIQSISLLGGIPVVLGSGLLFADERNLGIIIPALIALSAIAWSHWKNHHFVIAADTVPLVLWALTMPLVGAALSKILLTYWHPVSLEMIRAAGLALVVGPIYAGQSSHTPRRAVPWLIATNILTSLAWILFYIGYQKLGIIYTLLLFSLQPLLAYAMAIIFLKEPLEKKRAIAFAIVLMCIGLAQILK